MDIKLKPDPDRLILDDLIALESGTPSALFMRDFLARFLLNGDGDYMAENEAKKVIGKLSMTDLAHVTDLFNAAVKEMQETIIPPEIDSE